MAAAAVRAVTRSPARLVAALTARNWCSLSDHIHSPGPGARTDRRPRAGGGFPPVLYFSRKEDVGFPRVSEPTDRDLHSGPRSSLALQHCKTHLHCIPYIHLFPLSNANLTN